MNNTVGNTLGPQTTAADPVYVRVYNADATDAPPFCCLEKVAYDADNDRWEVRQPTVPGRTDLLFNGPAPVVVGQEGQAVASPHALALVERDAYFAPTVGEMWGCVPGNWALVRYSTGYVVEGFPRAQLNYAVVSTGGSAALRHVRPDDGAINGGQNGTALHPDARPGFAPLDLDGKSAVIDSGGWFGRHAGRYADTDAFAVDFRSSFRLFRVSVAPGVGTGAYSLVEVESNGTGTGYADVTGGITTAAAYEMNGTLIAVATVVRAALRIAIAGAEDADGYAATTAVWEFAASVAAGTTRNLVTSACPVKNTYGVMTGLTVEYTPVTFPVGTVFGTKFCVTDPVDCCPLTLLCDGCDTESVIPKEVWFNATSKTGAFASAPPGPATSSPAVVSGGPPQGSVFTNGWAFLIRFLCIDGGGYTVEVTASYGGGFTVAYVSTTSVASGWAVSPPTGVSVQFTKGIACGEDFDLSSPIALGVTNWTVGGTPSSFTFGISS